jgi:hypothetical protein
MNLGDNTILWIMGLVVLGLGCYFLVSFFSLEARERRKRNRNYGKVVARGRRPMVRLSVKSGKR